MILTNEIHAMQQALRSSPVGVDRDPEELIKLFRAFTEEMKYVQNKKD